MSKKEKDINTSLSRREFLRIFGLGAIALSLPHLGVKRDTIETSEDEVKKFLEVIEVERTSGIMVSDSTPIIGIPLRKDYFYNEARPIEKINLEKGVILGYKDIFTLKTGDDIKRFSILPHITGDSAIYLAELGETSLKYSSDRSVSEYTYSDNIYPNKIINILVAASLLLKYQKENGPFVSGKDYSLIDILQIGNNSDYVNGRTSRGWIVKGGGICASASTLAKSIYLAGGSFSQRWEHPTGSRYFVGPGDSRISKENSDATVGFGDNGEIYDFIWRIPEGNPLFLSISESIMLLSGQNARDLGPEADARLLLTISWNESQEKEDEIGRIADLISAYKSFRNSGASSLILRRSAISQLPWNLESKEKELAMQIWPEEDASHFSEEMHNDPWIRTNLILKELIDTYNRNIDYEYFVDNPKKTLGVFLKESSWYRGLSGKDKVDMALNHLDWNTYRWSGMSIQCIGWVILLASLDSYYSPKDIAGQEISVAADLVPEEIRQRKKTVISSNGLLISVAEKIEEVDVGDIFVTYDPSTPGHIGCVIGKKEIEGKTILLISDANRKNDGKVRMFEVNESNFNAVFGEYPQRKVFIKRGRI